MKSSVIYKYAVRPTDRQQLLMPEGARMLTVQLQRGEIMLWALVNESVNEEVRYVNIYGTGNPITSTCMGQYVGTVQQGCFVWHIFVE